MLAYLKAHWRGKQTIARSLLVNGALALFVLGLPMAPLSAPPTLEQTNVLTIAYVSVLVAWLGWFAVGTARSAVRTLRGGYSIVAKILAIIALVVVAAMLALFASDVQLVMRWIRGVAD
jgi:hypothetical protein